MFLFLKMGVLKRHLSLHGGVGVELPYLLDDQMQVVSMEGKIRSAGRG